MYLLTTGGSWNIFNFITNVGTSGETLAEGIVRIVGIIALLFAIIKGVKKIFDQREQMSWVMIGIAFAVGGILVAGAGGWDFFKGAASAQKDSLEQLGQGVKNSTNTILYLKGLF